MKHYRVVKSSELGPYVNIDYKAMLNNIYSLMAYMYVKIFLAYGCIYIKF